MQKPPSSNSPSVAPYAPPESDKLKSTPPVERPWFAPSSHPNPLCRVVLIEPEIPENTGNISRTCVGTESELHLVQPMSFELSEKRVRRAGLDYWRNLAWQTHANYADWRKTVPNKNRVFLLETTGKRSIFDAKFQRGDWLVFGKESAGLAPSIIEEFDGPSDGRSDGPDGQTDDQYDDQARDGGSFYLPMPGTTRSLNLSNAVAITVFELLRQITEQER